VSASEQRIYLKSLEHVLDLRDAMASTENLFCQRLDHIESILKLLVDLQQPNIADSIRNESVQTMREALQNLSSTSRLQQDALARAHGVFDQLAAALIAQKKSIPPEG
jgi:hypothetical protein